MTNDRRAAEDGSDGPPSGARRARRFRRAGLLVIFAVVVAACLGLLGPRTATVTAATGNVDVEVEYPRVTRPGLEVDIRVMAVGAARLDGEVVMVLDSSMYRDLGLEHVVPEPREQRTDEARMRLVFDAPRERRFSVTLSGRLPTQQGVGRYRHHLDLEVVAAGSVAVDVETWVLP